MRSLWESVPAAVLFVVAPFQAARRHLETKTDFATHGLSMRSNFAWILSGNVAFAICQWGGIVALARLGSSFIVGQFSLGLAIATPVLMFTNLHLRAVQATDARRLYSFSEYLSVRACLTLVGLAVIAGIACAGDYKRETAMVIIAVAFAKSIETLSDIHYGLFQLNDRLDQSGKSMMLRGVFAVLALSTGLYLGRSILWSCVALAIVWLAVLVFFDVRSGRRFTKTRQTSGKQIRRRGAWDLIRVALPLGIATTMAALNLNTPRYFIHARLGERQLGIYSAMAYTTVAMIVVSDSLAHCAIPRLAKLYSAKRMPEYRSLILKLLIAGGTLGIAGVVVTQLIGAKLLTLFYGSEYAAHYRVFRLLILATAIYCVACVFTSAITAARRFRIQVPLYASVLGSNALACAYWVPRAGLAGGAVGMLVAAMVHCAAGAAVVGGMLWYPRKTYVSRFDSCTFDWNANL